MAWALIASSVVVLWLASLFKVLLGSRSSPKPTFLNDGAGSRRRNVLLVIANHDDDSVFFAPTVNYLISRGHNLHVLCMSTGNAVLLHDPSGRQLEAWELVSTNTARKYSGPVDVSLSTLLARRKTNGQSHCLHNLNPRKSYAAMAQHASQRVWYRKLFVSFSSYTYVNTLEKIFL